MKIRWKILVFFMAVAVVPLIFAAFIFTGQKRTASVIENSLFALTNSASKLAEHFILNAQKSVITMSYVPEGLSPLRNSRPQRNYLRRIYGKYKIFSSVAFTDKYGREICRRGEALPGSLKKIIRSKKLLARSAVSGVTDEAGREKIAVMSRLHGASGWLAALIKSNSLKNILKKIAPYDGAIFYLTDPTGKILFLDKSLQKTSGGEFVSVKLSDGSSVLKGTLVRAGRKYFEVTAPVAGFHGWKLTLSSPYGKAFKNISDAKVLGVLFSVIALLLAGSLAFYFSKKLSDPLEELTQAAEELTAGNLSYRLKLRTGDEIEVLASKFNEMAETISEYQKGQKQKIKMSARDLSNAYREIAVKNEKLALADKYKSQFLATMSHELRTPMNAIIGFTDLLKDGIYGKLTEKQKEILSKVQRNSGHLLNLINDILDLSKIEAGRIELLPENFELADMINDVSRELPPPRPGVEFGVKCDRGTELFHDMMRLKQVVFNLLSNAFKFTKRGRVLLECSRGEQLVSIKVSDTGIGIKKDDIDKIFDSFQQADASITRQFQGTGLGLSISKKLIELMGGWIDVESREGEGTAFTVNIPYRYVLQKEGEEVKPDATSEGSEGTDS